MTTKDEMLGPQENGASYGGNQEQHSTTDAVTNTANTRRDLLISVLELARHTPLGVAASITLTACGGGAGKKKVDDDGGTSPDVPTTTQTTRSTTTSTTTSTTRFGATSTTFTFPTSTSSTSSTTRSSTTSSSSTVFPTTSTTGSSTSSTSASSSTTSLSSTTTSSSSTTLSSSSTSSTTSSSTVGSTTTTTNTDPGPAPGATRAFTFIGPNTVSVNSTSGMMIGGPVLTMADGTQVAAWTLNGTTSGFNSDRIVPGPVIELTQGQPAAITLNSALPHTIHPHGLDVNTANDGVPQTSGFVAAAMMFPIQQPGQVGGNLGSPFTYRFTAPFAGTYLYHCHVDAALHFEMGMYGAIIVRPPSGATNVAWDGGPAFTKEYIWQLGTFDSRWHTQNQTGVGTRRYMPDYFMINGRDGANLLTDPATAISAPQGSPVLLRLISYAYAPATVDLGGVTFDVIASDGRPLRSPITAQTSWRIMPGERYDLLITMPAAGTRQATVRYQNIRGTAQLGTAATSVTST